MLTKQQIDIMRPTKDGFFVAVTDELCDQAALAIELQKDAERWRWARQHPDWLGWDADYLPDSIDKTIDAARAAKADGE